MKTYTFITLTILLALLFTANNFAQTPEEFLKRGNERIKSKATLFEGISDLISAKSLYTKQCKELSVAEKFEQEIAILDKALAIEPDFTNAPKTKDFQKLRSANNLENQAIHMARSLAFLSSDKFDEAIAEDTWLIAHKTADLVEVYTHRGVGYLRKTDYEKATLDFNQAIKLNPKYPLSYYYLAQVYEAQNKLKLAIANVTTAIALTPKPDDVLYQYRGYLFSSDAQYQKALLDLNKSIRLNPTESVTYIYRGLTHKGLSQREQALADFKKALELDPTSKKAQELIDKMK